MVNYASYQTEFKMQDFIENASEELSGNDICAHTSLQNASDHFHNFINLINLPQTQTLAKHSSVF